MPGLGKVLLRDFALKAAGPRQPDVGVAGQAAATHTKGFIPNSMVLSNLGPPVERIE